MNTTQHIIEQAPGRHNDVRPTSHDDNYPYSVIVRLVNDEILWQGFHAGRGIEAPVYRTSRRQALRDIRELCEGRYITLVNADHIICEEDE